MLDSEHTMYRWYIIEYFTWNLYNFSDQCHPKKFIFFFKKGKKKRKRHYSMLPFLSLSLSLSQNMNRGKAMWRHNKNAAVNKPGREI